MNFSYSSSLHDSNNLSCYSILEIGITIILRRVVSIYSSFGDASQKTLQTSKFVQVLWIVMQKYCESMVPRSGTREETVPHVSLASDVFRKRWKGRARKKCAGSDPNRPAPCISKSCLHVGESFGCGNDSWVSHKLYSNQTISDFVNWCCSLL